MTLEESNARPDAERDLLARCAAPRWAAQMASGGPTPGADDVVRTALAEGNQKYEARFGHVYLVCASGRSAEDLVRQDARP